MSSPASEDQKTADQFAHSWNNVYDASVYTREQFDDWIQPLTKADIAGRCVMELGCGSGALLHHMVALEPQKLLGIDLGSSVQRARDLLRGTMAVIDNGDITDTRGLLEKYGTQDVTYCIGVLHHLKSPGRGFESLVALAKPGGRFHGWVYAYEGNAMVRWFVDPLRRLASRLPWKANKNFIALPLAVPFFIYSNFCRLAFRVAKGLPLPMKDYMLWISERDFNFHHHVAFDQLVTPVTHYIRRDTVEKWLQHPRIDPASTYIILRNGNGWKFGGKVRAEEIK